MYLVIFHECAFHNILFLLIFTTLQTVKVEPENICNFIKLLVLYSRKLW